MTRRTVSLSSGEVEVDVIRSSRRTVALYVRPGGTVLIRAPWFVPVRVLMQFAAGKAGWIEKQRTRMKCYTPPGTLLSVADGSTVPYMGKQLKVQVIKGSVRKVTHDDERLNLYIKGETSPEEMAGMTEAWYLRESKAYLPERTRDIAAIHSDKLPVPASVNVRQMKRRWGTCHSNGAIWLNRELIKKDPDLIDYVIIHELCHLVHQNHGKDYYALLSSIIPDFREKRRRLQN